MSHHLLRRRGASLSGALVLAVAGALTLGACEEPGPGPSASTSVPYVPATTIFGTPSFPSPLVAVGEDNAVVTLNSDGDRVKTLVPAGGDLINGITLSGDKTTAYFDTVGAGGVITHAVKTDGSGPAQAVAMGGWPAAARTGNKLAYVTTSKVFVHDMVTGQQWAWNLPGPASFLAWSGDELMWVQDGTSLVVLDTVTPGATPQPVAGSAARPGERLYATAGGWSGELFRATIGFGYNDTSTGIMHVSSSLTVSRTEPTENAGVRDRSAFTGGYWALTVDALHNARWAVGGGTGLIAPDYLFADW